MRSLRSLEAAWRTADRLGARHRRRSSYQHPSVHVGRSHDGAAARAPVSCASDRRSPGRRTAGRKRSSRASAGSRRGWTGTTTRTLMSTRTQALRPREHYPWFWGCPGDGTRTERTDFMGGPDFDGNRWNNLYYTNAAKAGRSVATREADSGRSTFRLPIQRHAGPRPNR